MTAEIAWERAPAGRAGRRAVAWGVVRRMLADRGHPGAVLTNPCPRCGGPHGPVRVSGAPWRAAVTYAAGWAVVAVRPDDGRAFAIDAEPLHDAVREAAGWPATGGGLLHWVRAEAALKADGRGLAIDVGSVRIGPHGRDRWTATVPGAPAAFAGTEVDGPPGVLVSVAVQEAAAGPAHRARP